jgi:hypothetical protein
MGRRRGLADLKHEFRNEDVKNPKLETLNSKQAQMSKTQNSESKEEQIMEKRSLTKEMRDFRKILGPIVEKSK